MAYRNYTAGSTGFLVAKDGTGDFTTIGAALAAATSGMTIFVKESATAYTENLTLKGGVNITAYVSDYQSANVTIIGKASKSVSGDVSISGIYLQTNGDYIISNTASGHINLTDCWLQAQDHTLISQSTGGLNVFNCIIDYATTGITFAATTGGIVVLYYCREYNSGSTVTSSTYAATVVTYFYCTITTPITTSTTSQLFMRYSNLIFSNTTCLTAGGSNSHQILESSFTSGTATAIVANTTVTITGGMVNSSNTNAISGSGTLNYGGIIFIGTSSTISTSTQNPVAWTVPQGGTGLTATTINQILYSSGTSVIAGLATANNGVLITSASGVPSILADGTTGQVFTATTGAPPAWAALPFVQLPWTDEAISFNAVAGNGYFVTATSTATLPASPAQGNTIAFEVDGSGSLLTITANTGQIIRLGNTVTASAGTAVNIAQGDSITLVYRASDTSWQAVHAIGNWNLT